MKSITFTGDVVSAEEFAKLKATPAETKVITPVKAVKKS
jgi:hypothetical protein